MYLPKSKYRTSTAKPGEYIDTTGKQYVGPVVETFTGDVYPGTDPMTMGPKLTAAGVKAQPELGLYNIKREPTEAEYKAGWMIRYFMQDLKTQKIIELSPEAWQKNFDPGDLTRTWLNITWYLTGARGTVQDLNGSMIQTLEKAMPGIISSRVLYDPLQFYKAKA